MNAFFSIHSATSWHVIGFAVDLGIKATIGLLAALAVTAGARRRSAALRHRVWFLTFCGLLLLPVLPLAMPKWQIPLPSAFDRAQPEVSQIPVNVPPDMTSIDPANQNHPALQLDSASVASSRRDDVSWSADAASLRAVERGRPPETTSAPLRSITTPILAVAVTPPTRLPDQSAGYY